MNHKRIYDDIINKAFYGNRNRGKIYYENHHIIPKCLGGLNDENNLVLLTPREHFICHKLLVEIYPKNRSLVYALHMMMSCKNQNKYNDRDYKISSREYERIRIEVSKISSIRFRGENNPMFGSKRFGELNPNFGNKLSEESKRKISIKAKGRIKSEEVREKLRIAGKIRSGENHHMFGKKHSEESKIKMRKSNHRFSGEDHPMFGKHHTENSRKKMSESRRGEKSHMFGVPKSFEIKMKISQSKKNQEKICPYCYKLLDTLNAKRWHFDNCLENPNNNKMELKKIRKENSPTFNKKLSVETRIKISEKAKNRIIS
jgi:hypothetical protein